MLADIAKKILGISGRCFGSKSGYTIRYPKNLAIFNANLCTKEDGKFWHGDIDLTKDEPIIKKLAAEINKTVYVLYEMDARFDNEAAPLLDKFIYQVDAAGTASVGGWVNKYYKRTKRGLLKKSADSDE